MGITDKLTAQAAAQLGEPVEFATMVVPPGATLYKGYAPTTSAKANASPIVAAIMSKRMDAGGGIAGGFPRQMGVLGVTADRVVYFKKKLVGTGCGELLTSWPRTDIADAQFASDGKWSYPGVLISFVDESSVALFGEKRWGFEQLATTLSPG